MNIKVYFKKDEVKDLFFESEDYQNALYTLQENIFEGKGVEEHRGWSIVMEDDMCQNIMPCEIHVPMHTEDDYVIELGEDPWVSLDIEHKIGWYLQGDGNCAFYDTPSVDEAIKLWKETDDEGGAN